MGNRSAHYLSKKQSQGLGGIHPKTMLYPRISPFYSTTGEILVITGTFVWDPDRHLYVCVIRGVQRVPQADITFRNTINHVTGAVI